MVNYDRTKRQQLLREAEGYLDLVTSCADDFPLQPTLRDRLAERAVTVLSSISAEGIEREDLFYLRGQAYRVMERHHEAIQWLEEAAEVNPDNLHTWLALAWCQKRVGRLDLAIQSLEEALSVASDHAIIYYNLACYWSLAKNSKLAIAYLARSFDIDSSYRDLVAGETDFDAIRNHPSFLELTSVIV
ncbi:MAG: tetratricopeptide repeat protein [Planctomycetes bacterium]|nr:tetratricopeptide repeat protein [Planctomycetota bacterium]